MLKDTTIVVFLERRRRVELLVSCIFVDGGPKTNTNM
jgi:hypothetical protein